MSRRGRAPAAWVVALASASVGGALWLTWPQAWQRCGTTPEAVGARSAEEAVLQRFRDGDVDASRARWTRFAPGDVRFRGSRDAPDGGLVLVLHADAPPRDGSPGVRCRIEVLTHEHDGGWRVTRFMRETSTCSGDGSLAPHTGE